MARVRAGAGVSEVTVGLLTASELAALRLTADLVNLLALDIVGDGPTQRADIAELVVHIHAIQHMVMAQAAARAYPGEFRLLGMDIRGEGVR